MAETASSHLIAPISPLPGPPSGLIKPLPPDTFPFVPPGTIPLFPPGTIPLFPPGGQPDTRGIGTDLTESDRRTLRGALGLLKTARVDAKSADLKVALPAKRRLASLVCYLAGFFDGKRIVGVNPGFIQLAQSQLAPVDLDSQLDGLQKILEETSAATRTGFLAPLGAIYVGLGIGMRMIGDKIDENEKKQ